MHICIPGIFVGKQGGLNSSLPDFQTPCASYYTSATAKNIYHTEQSWFLNVCKMSVKWLMDNISHLKSTLPEDIVYKWVADKDLGNTHIKQSNHS